MKNIISKLIAITLFGIFSGKAFAIENFTEISGIARKGNALLVVSDNTPGTYYKIPLTDIYRKEIKAQLDKEGVALIKLTSTQAPVRIQGADLAMDLESIEVLTDGEVVVLSEQLNALIVEKDEDSNKSLSSRFLYEEKLGEVGGRGLEGLAVKSSKNDTNYIAVLWEGGYFSTRDLLNNATIPKAKINSHPLVKKSSKPLILVHEVESKKTKQYKSIYDKAPFWDIILDTPTPPSIKAHTDHDQYRAPDLVWYKKGFIVLLGSMSKDEKLELNRRFKNTMLFYFGRNGKPVLGKNKKPLSLNIKELITIKSLIGTDGKSLKDKNGNDLVSKDGKSLNNLKNIKWDVVVGKELKELVKDESELKKVNKNWSKLINRNWEGMDWYEEGKSLILVYDDGDEEEVPSALVVNIPKEWND